MVQDQLRTAHALIEQGRIDEARRLLRTLDDPTARLWLSQLNANRRTRRQTVSVPLPLLIALAVVIGVVALGIILLLTPTLLDRIQNQAQDRAALNADEQLQAQLILYCTPASGSRAEACSNWADGVVAEHRDAALSCLAQYGVETPEDRAVLADCLATNGVPPF